MIEAIITGIVAVMVCMINNYYQQKAVKEQHDKTIGLIEYRMKQLESKVDLHNNAIERLYCVEKKQSVQQEQIKEVNHRIEDLKERVEP